MADESDDLRSRTSEFGDAVKKFIDDVKPFTELLPHAVQIAAFIGGALLVGYAVKEHFFYDLSSIAAIALLFITFFSFSLILILFIIYTFLGTMWIAWVLYHFMSWIGPCIRLPIVRPLRPAVTRGRVVFSLLLFLWMAVLLFFAKWTTITLPVIGYTITTGFIMNCVFIISPLPGESERLQLLLTFLGVPLLMFLVFSGPPSVFGSLLNSTMTILSFRSAPDQPVSLNEQAYEKVRAIATSAGVTMDSCQVAKNSWVLKEATLVWHGIGATAYLLITGKPDASLLIPLPNDGVEVLYSTRLQLPRHCAPG